MAVDWLKIRNEYINTRTSYRKLAEKYGVCKDTIAIRAKAENWAGERENQTDKIQAAVRQKTVEKVSASEADRIARLMHSVTRLNDLLDKKIGQMESAEEISSYDLKTASETARNLRGLYQTDGGSKAELSAIRKLLGGVDSAID